MGNDFSDTNTAKPPNYTTSFTRDKQDSLVYTNETFGKSADNSKADDIPLGGESSAFSRNNADDTYAKPAEKFKANSSPLTQKSSGYSSNNGNDSGYKYSYPSGGGGGGYTKHDDDHDTWSMGSWRFHEVYTYIYIWNTGKYLYISAF